MKTKSQYEILSLNTLLEIDTELKRAKQMYPAFFANAHEGFAVILEEIDELWDEVKKRRSASNTTDMRKEAIQAAAMLVRFVIELCQSR